ncbi:angio-associated migratory cell protein [Dermochelys coriacea]|uniref:angio-associated migratory cell protein n=1 Tax=Dermochelys coriacea TaxID=27794 RepID=UPI001CA9E00A|nr:angio-associated migratory cell protein [Dermochelys coriacea]
MPGGFPLPPPKGGAYSAESGDWLGRPRPARRLAEPGTAPVPWARRGGGADGRGAPRPSAARSQPGMEPGTGEGGAAGAVLFHGDEEIIEVVELGPPGPDDQANEMKDDSPDPCWRTTALAYALLDNVRHIY